MDRLKLKQSVSIYLSSYRNTTKISRVKPMIIAKYSKTSESIAPIIFEVEAAK